MKRRRGQALVEFALIAPLVFLMIFGMIWGAIMFMEYMHYSNAVRMAAREIAVSNNPQESAVKKKEWLENLYRNEISIKFYKPTVTFNDNNQIADEDKDIKFYITFHMEDSEFYSLPYILQLVEFPPRDIKALQYSMPIERRLTSTDSEGQ